MDGMSISERGAALLNAGQSVQAVSDAGQSDRVPAGGWLKAVRVAGGASQSELAAKLGFKRQAWAQFEASEARGAISLASLRRAADALGCDFSYQVVPRESSRAGVRGSKKQVRPAPTQRHETDERVRTAIPTQTKVTQAEARLSVSPFSIEQELPVELR